MISRAETRHNQDMRRSAAPSQANSGFKRVKFTAPAPVRRKGDVTKNGLSAVNDSDSRDCISNQRESNTSHVHPKPVEKLSIFNSVIKADKEMCNGPVKVKDPHSSMHSGPLIGGGGNTSSSGADETHQARCHNNGSTIQTSCDRTLPRRDLSAVLSLTATTVTTFPKSNEAPQNDDDTSLLYVPFSSSSSSMLVTDTDNKEESRWPLEELECDSAIVPKDIAIVPDVPQTNQTRTVSQEPGAHFFNVVWCKLSKKKHKKWEGDAVLSTKGRSATLYDMEGKVIGKGTGYRIAQLENLAEDETLMIGGKEIQVMSSLKEEHFRSGKCFSATGTCSESTSHSTVSKSKNGSFKPFVNPVKCGNGLLPSLALPQPEASATARFDPTAPDALVMPRPSADHQWRYNKSSLPIVDVVVDPYLTHFLRDHQRHGIVFLYECIMGMRDFEGHGAVLADDMGLGKTLQCISLIWTLLKQGPYGGKPVAKKVLIITPGSLVTNWYMEFKKWLGVERLNVFAASGDKRVDEFVKSGMFPVLVISYEMMVRYFDTIKDLRFDLIVCDEGHRLKNTAIKTTSMIASLPTRKRVVLTGTPVQNDLQEFYSIVEFCNPGVLGSSGAFKRVYEDPIILSRQPKASVVQKELGKDRAEELTRLTQMFVLRRTQEINNQYLPPKVELVLFCRPSGLQLTLYRQLVCSQVFRRCLSGNLSGAPHLICIGALKEVCNHPSLVFRKAMALESSRGSGDGEDSIYANLLPLFPPNFDPNCACLEDSGKLEVLSRILTSIWQTSNHEKVVLVANHTKTLDILQGFCQNKGYVCLRLDGQTPTTQRQQLVNKFNSRHNTTDRIFLLSSKAGGVGLNLIGASRLILYDIDWNPANDLQAMARVWRDGQKGKVHIYRLLTTGCIEEKIYQRQISKQGLSGAVMDITNKNNVQFSVDDLKDLFTLNEKTECETHSMLACDCQGDPTLRTTPQPQPTPPQDDRPCQLGQNISVSKTKGKAKNLTMAELLGWKHWQGHLAKDGETWFLDRVGSVLSFMFWHETNAQNHAA